MPGATPEISVVVPVYGCAGAIEELHRRLTATLAAMGVGYELLLVDDRSPDDSWARMERLAAGDPRTGVFRMTRNFGQHAAITAGLGRARGRHVVVMDCDLQDPPELLPQLYAEALAGKDVIWARQNAKQTSRMRHLGGHVYYRLLAIMAGVHIDPQQGTFSLISRRVVDEVLGFSDVDRNYVFLLGWLGFPETVVHYDRDERFEGRSSYTLRKLVRHAVSGLVFQTTVLLRYVIYLGFALAAIGALAAVFLVVQKLRGGLYPGWTSLAVFTLTVGGFVIMSTGVTGLYIGKIFDQVRRRPLFVLDVDQPATDVTRASAADTEKTAALR